MSLAYMVQTNLVKSSLFLVAIAAVFRIFATQKVMTMNCVENHCNTNCSSLPELTKWTAVHAAASLLCRDKHNIMPALLWE